MPGDPWLAILVESVSRKISALLFTGSLSEGSQECTVTLSTLAEVGTLGTACSLLLQIYPRTVWWRGHTVTGTRRKCWSSDPAFPGDIHVLPFSTCACESPPPGWSHESYPHLHREEEGSEWCLPWSIQSSPPFLSSNPRAHHLGKPPLPSRLVRCGDTSSLFHIAGSISILSWPLTH